MINDVHKSIENDPNEFQKDFKNNTKNDNAIKSSNFKISNDDYDHYGNNVRVVSFRTQNIKTVIKRK